MQLYFIQERSLIYVEKDYRVHLKSNTQHLYVVCQPRHRTCFPTPEIGWRRKGEPSPRALAEFSPPDSQNELPFVDSSFQQPQRAADMFRSLLQQQAVLQKRKVLCCRCCIYCNDGKFIGPAVESAPRGVSWGRPLCVVLKKEERNRVLLIAGYTCLVQFLEPLNTPLHWLRCRVSTPELKAAASQRTCYNASQRHHP